MAGASVRITVDDSGLGEALRRLAAAAADMTPAMDEIGSHMVSTVDRRFETESGPGGSPWPPSIRARIEGGQTLSKSARLRQSITHRAGRSAVEVGTNVIYAAIHQFGGTIRPKAGGRLGFALPGGLGFVSVASVTLPPRPFLGVDDDDRTEIRAIFGDWLRSVARGVGRGAGAGGSSGGSST